MKVLYAGGTQVANLIALENPGVTPQVGFVYKLAGQSTGAYNGDGGLASSAQLVVVRDLVLDSNNNIYVSDGNSTSASANTVRRIDALTGIITTYAGGAGCTKGGTSCPAGFAGDGGPATAALLSGPYTMFVDRFNNLFISEFSNNRLRVVYAGGTVGGLTNPVVGNIYTYAGTGTSGATPDNTPAAQVNLGSVQVAGIDPSGNIYLEDATTKVMWRFDAVTSIGSVIAGHSSGSTPTAGVFCTGTTGTAGPKSVDNYGDGCPGPQAGLSDIGRISFDGQGNFYTGENGNGVVRMYSYNTQFPPTAVAATTTQPLAYKATTAVTLATETFALQGNATTEYNDAGAGTCTATSVLTVAQVCVFNVNFTPAHDGLRPGSTTVTTATSSVTQLLSGVGVAANIAIDPSTNSSAGTGLAPSGIVADLFGNIYVADQTGNRILAGSASATTLSPIITGLNKPSGLALDSLGNLYIADTANNRVVKATTSGTIIGTVGTGAHRSAGRCSGRFRQCLHRGHRQQSRRAGHAQRRAVRRSAHRPHRAHANHLRFRSATSSSSTPATRASLSSSSARVRPPSRSAPASFPRRLPSTPPAPSTSLTPSASNCSPSLPAPSSATRCSPGSSSRPRIAADQDANLYVADTGITSATYLRRSLANVTFPITNVGQSSTASIGVSNVGNATLTFPTHERLPPSSARQRLRLRLRPPMAAAPASATLPEASCSFTATFSPTAKGVVTATARFNTNAANTTSASALLTGNGQQLVTTSQRPSQSPRPRAPSRTASKSSSPPALRPPRTLARLPAPSPSPSTTKRKRRCLSAQEPTPSR